MFPDKSEAIFVIFLVVFFAGVLFVVVVFVWFVRFDGTGLVVFANGIVVFIGVD